MVGAFHRTYIGMIERGGYNCAVDRLTKEKRSWLMSRVGSKDTTPELIVRSLVHKLGFRFRLHYKKLPGKPDLAFPGRKKVIFVHGCFWHGHKNCRKGCLPKSNLEVWATKRSRNKARDQQVAKSIRLEGWRVLTIWQCETENIDRLQSKLIRFLT